MNQIEQLFSQYPNLSPTVIERLMAKAIAGIESDIQEIQSRQQKAADDYLADFATVSSTPVTTGQAKPSGKSWIMRRSKRAMNAYEAMEKGLRTIPAVGRNADLLDLIRVAQTASDWTVRQTAMRKVFDARDADPAMRGDFHNVIEAWGKRP